MSEIREIVRRLKESDQDAELTENLTEIIRYRQRQRRLTWLFSLCEVDAAGLDESSPPRTCRIGEAALSRGI